jgi:hypothetical protein
MKKGIIIGLFAFVNSLVVGQTNLGKIKIHLDNRFTDQTINLTTFTLTLNDSIKSIYTTDSQGDALSSDLKKGNYKAEILCDKFQTLYHTVVVSENKTSSLTFKLMPTNYHQITNKNK